ncbi:polysaccharide deacetylase family protein [Algiphilus sp. NNCM1]|uniref:polysaccharide deacetylase family protein n=1 Tax=Algiphilus sp. TaxID=1872431 RepID=UPI001CA6BF55|nr:polysaccharide deacetylase family protein [Algiphilus sp.]MBY8964514.1 polysaccharide deacetylase family protein [Algiphilus acroporae]MCI5063360.1 polysaccharide deacetylase family protein [Algiphilus sp.]MCI5104750.1 polysaccharide deacetylase family protein [Algiphilus sp.]
MRRHRSPDLRAWLSIHDVMPETLDRVASLIAHSRAQGWAPATLLVVPGKPWKGAALAQLRRWHDEGHALAAHGWLHRALHVRGLRHRVHSALISRDAAEHLALDRASIGRLMQASHDWFGEHGLPLPTLYVPPAWALGDMDRASLRALPFRHIEVTSGIIHTESGRLEAQPLIGFEADQRWRAHALQTWNRAQITLARRTGRTLRVGIHPHDPELALSAALERVLAQPPGREPTGAAAHYQAPPVH